MFWQTPLPPLASSVFVVYLEGTLPCLFNSMPSSLSDDLSQKIQQATSVDFDNLDEKIPVLDISKTQLVRVLTILRGHQNLEFFHFTDLIVIDNPENDKRFELNYLLLKLQSMSRLDVRIHLEEDEPVDSITPIFSAAHWYECEAWEFFGIPFNNNHKIQHLILPEGSSDFPLKKL